jgi:hypothetical protein
MRRLMVLGVLLSLFMTAAPVTASDTTGPFIPWHPPEQEISVAVGETFLIGARFGTCTRGLAVAFSKAATLELSVALEGSGVEPESVPITEAWTRPLVPDDVITIADPSNCLSSAHQEFFWWVFWEQGIQFAEPGVYYVHLALGSSHQLTDGWDGDDQDGTPDRYGPGPIVGGTLSVNVTDS